MSVEAFTASVASGQSSPGFSATGGTNSGLAIGGPS
ncbi:Uncharacterised protein [Mycobacteroides abscessus subsp. abscessus]|nr:Uncharacterised protein [Mycobacteroides abscessus subsp. abscessus]